MIFLKKAMPKVHTHTFGGSNKRTYDVFKLWDLAPKETEELPVANIKHVLKRKMWGKREEGKKNWMKPVDIMKAKEGPHWDRIQKADLSHPILIGPEEGMVPDGYHRIAKAVLERAKTIKARRFTSYEQMEPALVKEDIKKAELRDMIPPGSRSRLWGHLESDIQERSDDKDSKLKLKGSWKKLKFKLEGKKVFAVDPEWVRTNLSVIFGSGGHGRVHEFIPNDEIWVATHSPKGKKFTAKEFMGITVHEKSEFDDMGKGDSYLTAHRKAENNESEWKKTKKAAADVRVTTPFKGEFADNNAGTVYDWLKNQYLRDIKDPVRAGRVAEKTIGHHSGLLEILSRILGADTRTVLAPASGAGHEQLLRNLYPGLRSKHFIGLEGQQPLVDWAIRRNMVHNMHGNRNLPWNLVKNLPPEEAAKLLRATSPEALAAITSETMAKLTPAVPPTTKHPLGLYLQHACGGLTDANLAACKVKNIPAIAATTCCSDTFAPVSYKAMKEHGVNISPELYSKLVRESSMQGPKGIDAQQAIDQLRVNMLKNKGYAARAGWANDTEGKPLQKGGWLAAVPPDRAARLETLTSEFITKARQHGLNLAKTLPMLAKHGSAEYSTGMKVKLTDIVKKAQAADKSKFDNAAVDTGVTGAGLYAASKGSPMLRGKEVFYHGTSKDALKDILRDGIKTMGQMERDSGRSQNLGVFDNLPEELRNKVRGESAGMAFVTKHKSTANMYAMQATLFNKLVAKYGPDKGSTAYTKLLRSLNNDPMQLLDVILEHKVFPGLSGKTLKVEMPLHELGKLKPNPELASVAHQRKIPAFDIFGLREKAMDAAEQSLKASPGLEGGIPPELIRGGKGFRNFSWEGMKVRPGRTAAGAGLVALGLTGAGYGGKRLVSRMQHKEAQAAEAIEGGSKLITSLGAVDDVVLSLLNKAKAISQRKKEEEQPTQPVPPVEPEPLKQAQYAGDIEGAERVSRNISTSLGAVDDVIISIRNKIQEFRERRRKRQEAETYQLKTGQAAMVLDKGTLFADDIINAVKHHVQDKNDKKKRQQQVPHQRRPMRKKAVRLDDLIRTAIK